MRENARKNVLGSAEFRAVVEDIRPSLDGPGRDAQMEYALVGGLAVAAYANPPVTVDVDILLKSMRPREIFESCKSRFRPRWRVTQFGFPMRRSGPGKPSHGVRLSREEPFAAVVDIILTGADRFLQSAVDHAKWVIVQPGLELRVITVEDLIVMKMISGREKDNDDVAALSALPDLDDEYIQAALDALGWYDLD